MIVRFVGQEVFQEIQKIEGTWGCLELFLEKGFVSRCLSGFVDLIAFDILFHLLYTFLSIEDCFGLMRC